MGKGDGENALENLTKLVSTDLENLREDTVRAWCLIRVESPKLGTDSLSGDGNGGARANYGVSKSGVDRVKILREI